MEEFDLREYATILKKRWHPVVFIPIIAIIISAFLSYFVMKPEYQATATLVVLQKPTGDPITQYETVMADEDLVKTYSTIIKSRSIENEVIQNLHLPYSPEQLDGMITITAPDQTLVVQISVTSRDETQAAQIANAVTNTFISRTEQTVDMSNVEVIDPAAIVPGAKPIKPNKKLNMVIAAIMGLILGVSLAFLLEYLDNKLRTEEDVARYLHLPVIGEVFDFLED